MSSPSESSDPTPSTDGQEGARDTRRRIITAARRIIVEEGYDQLSLTRVADRAEVARATIYYQFGSKSGLLDGLIGAIELDARIHESREHDHTPGDLLQRVIRIWEGHREVVRSIIAIAAVDPDSSKIIARHEHGRRQRITELVDELDEAGRLDSDREDAIDLLWLLTSFQAYDFLRELTAREPEEIARLLEALAGSLLACENGRP